MTELSLRALRYFVAVVDTGSITAAAEAIFVAQPALTRQVRELENELGVQLLLRTPRGVRLTPAGLTLYESAQRMLAEGARVRQQLAQQRGARERRVVLGVSPTLARVLLPGLLEHCANDESGLQLQAREGFTPTLLEWLERGVVDMAVVTNAEPGRQLALTPLLGEPFALSAHVEHAIGAAVNLQQLARVPLVMTTLHRSIVERQIAPLGGRIDVRAQIDSVDSIRELVLRGRFATVMPVSVFRDPMSASRVALTEILGVQLHRILSLATRLDWRDHPAVPMLRDVLEAEFAGLVRAGVFSFGTVASQPQRAPRRRAQAARKRSTAQP